MERVGATSGNRMSYKWIEVQQVEIEKVQQVGKASQMEWYDLEVGNLDILCMLI